MHAIRRNLALGIAAALPFAALAQGSGLKPGLWEVKQLKQVMDGKDMGAQMAAAQAQMQQAFANMPPAQRKQMEAMMAKQGVSPPAGGAGATRVCISPEMAARDKPMVDPEGRCEPTRFNRSGNRVSFEVNCNMEGRQMTGKGESTTSPDSVSTRMDMTMTGHDGRHTMQSETRMQWLGADCGNVKPADQMVREMQGGMRKK